jgi:hypothetical protein
LGRVGGEEEEPMMGRSLEADLVTGSSWVADPVEEAPPKPRGTGRGVRKQQRG